MIIRFKVLLQNCFETNCHCESLLSDNFDRKCNYSQKFVKLSMHLVDSDCILNVICNCYIQNLLKKTLNAADIRSLYMYLLDFILIGFIINKAVLYSMEGQRP